MMVLLLLVLALGSAPSVWAQSGTRPALSKDPCGLFQFGPVILFSVCTPQSTYKHGSTVPIYLNSANIGSTDGSLFALGVAYVFAVSKPKVEFSSLSFKCATNPCTIPAGQTITMPFSWVTSPKSSNGSIPPGTYDIQGQLLACQRISPTEVTCGTSLGILALADVTVTIT